MLTRMLRMLRLATPECFRSNEPPTSDRSICRRDQPPWGEKKFTFSNRSFRRKAVYRNDPSKCKHGEWVDAAFSRDWYETFASKSSSIS